jgi:hypothetical protein
MWCWAPRVTLSVLEGTNDFHFLSEFSPRGESAAINAEKQSAAIALAEAAAKSAT